MLQLDLDQMPDRLQICFIFQILCQKYPSLVEVSERFFLLFLDRPEGFKDLTLNAYSIFSEFHHLCYCVLLLLDVFKNFSFSWSRQ